MTKPITETRCPACHTPIDQATAAAGTPEERPIQTGDLTLCLYCDAASTFSPEGVLVLLDEAGLDADDRALLEAARSEATRVRGQVLGS